MLGQEFMQNALLGGSLVAIGSGLVGYFLVLRSQVFAGDALSHAAFTGALAAVAFGVDVRAGLFAAGIAVALGMGALGERARADDVTIGTVFAWVLGIGVLFLAIFNTRSGSNGTAAVRVLFGSILGLSRQAAVVAASIGAGVALAVLAVARPLLFSSLDPEVAAAQGVPVRLLGFVFLAVLGAIAAEATQAVGALLLLGLVAAPAGAAHLIARNPYRALALSVLFALGAVWAGLVLSYYVTRVPPSTAIVFVAAAIYLGAAVQSRLRRERD